MKARSPEEEQHLLAAICRKSFKWFFQRAFRELWPAAEYLGNWHLDALFHQVQRLQSQETRRLLVTMPPRHLKSSVLSVAWPAYLLGLDPHAHIIVASYGQDLARDLSAGTRRLMESSWYRQIFPDTVLKKGSITQDRFSTTAGGFRQATSTGGALTGKGCDVLIIDDPIKADDAKYDTQRQNTIDWFNNVAATRLDHLDKGSIIVTQQRLHESDLAGVLIERGGWHHLNLPAIATRDEIIELGNGKRHGRRIGEALHPQRLSLAALEKQRADIGESAFAAQYQQDPTAVGANILSWNWFRLFDYPLRRRSTDYVVQSWDLAYTTTASSDYTVGLTFLIRGQQVFLIDLYRVKCSSVDLLKVIPAKARDHQANQVVLETSGAGRVIADQLHQLDPLLYLGGPVTDSKLARLEIAALYVKRRRVFIDRRLPSLDDLRRELIGFPHAKHDDIADAFSFFFWFFSSTRKPELQFARELTAREPEG